MPGFGNRFPPSRVSDRMQPLAQSQRQVLDEDLQIIRVTLATITGDIRGFSERAADAIQEALAKLEVAQREFSRCRGAGRRQFPPRALSNS